MRELNGSATGLAVILGELKAESRRTIDTIERQNEILLDIKDTLHALPSRLATTISTASASPSAQPRILPELSELLRALYPPLILLAALVARTALPEHGVLQVLGEAILAGIL